MPILSFFESKTMDRAFVLAGTVAGFSLPYIAKYCGYDHLPPDPQHPEGAEFTWVTATCFSLNTGVFGTGIGGVAHMALRPLVRGIDQVCLLVARSNLG